MADVWRTLQEVGKQVRQVADCQRRRKKGAPWRGEKGPLWGVRRVPASLDGADRRIVERLAPSLRRDGLFFVGIDVIGGYLTEVNVTSPTGIQEINALDGSHLEGVILDRLESRVRQPDPQFHR